MKSLGRLEITTVIGCNINCVYCPQRLLAHRYFKIDKNRKSRLELDDFKRCLDKVPRGTRIDFSGMAEPWLNNQCTDMVCYAAEKGYPIAIYTTLVGMNKTDFERIKRLPIEEFVLHIPDDKSNAHIDITESYINLLEEVVSCKKDGIPIVTGFSCHAGIHPSIKNAIPEGSNLITELINRAGNIENEYVKKKSTAGEIICINCDANINHNVLLPDGTILLCCMDYGMEHILGNLLLDDYNEILKSTEAEHVLAGMKDDTADILCRNCTNARNIHEIYTDFKEASIWCKGLLKIEKELKVELKRVTEQYDLRIKELADYRTWVENYRELEVELKKELAQITEQYNLRIKELTDYRIWVENYEQLEKQLKSELATIKEQYNVCSKELDIYRTIVSKE